MVDLATTLLASTVLVNLALAAFVYSSNPRSQINVSFSLFVICLATWAVFILCFRLTQSDVAAVVYLKVSYVSATLIGCCFYYFSVVFPGEVRPTRPHATALLVVTIAMCSALALPSFLTGVVVVVAYGKEVMLDLADYLLFSLVFCSLFVGGQVRIWRKYVKASGLLRTQLLSIGISVSVIGCLGMYYNLLLPSPFFEDFQYVWTGPIFTSVFAIIITYSIFRYRLFATKALIAEVLVFALWLLLFIRLLTATSRFDQFGDGLVLALSAPIGMLLLRSVKLEVDARERLAAANERLQELDHMKSEFLSLATHQLRGPVSVIRGFAASLLDGSYGALPTEAIAAVNGISDSSRGLAAVIEDYLNVSRIEQGHMVYTFQNTDLKPAVEAVVRSLTPVARRKGLNLTLSVEGETPFATRIDSEKIEQVVFNLIENAIKYTKDGAIDVNLSHNLRQNMVQLSIRDSGMGIDPMTLPRLFQRFSRGQEARAVNAGGSGIGLYVARQIVDAHHGKIWAVSEGTNRGATFFVDLPVVG